MRVFDYTVTEELGLHARPAGMLTKLAGGYKSTITISRDGGAGVNVKRINSVMRLCVKQGDMVHFAVEGEDEEAAMAAVEALCRENL